MRGFEQRQTVDVALRWIDEHVAELEPEFVPLAHAAGRVLVEDIASPMDVPPFDRALMDGFAVRGENTRGASTFNQVTLKIVGRSMPGDPFTGELTDDEAVQIATGAPLPAGADAVVPRELAHQEGDHVQVHGEAMPGKNVGYRGEDFSASARVLPLGRRLRPQDIGLLASMGLPQVPVVRQPRVRIVITGNELLPAGAPPQPNCIFDANGPMLAALVQRDGGLPILGEILPDDPRQLTMALNDPDADMILVSGGSSVGETDHAPRLVAELGQLAIHGVAIRPSSPTGIGRIGSRFVFLLPGNPVACLCAYDFFGGRALRVLAGRERNWPYRTLKLPLRRKLDSSPGRVDYARVVVVENEVEPLSVTGASLLSSASRATGFIVVPHHVDGIPAGANVEVHLYDSAG